MSETIKQTRLDNGLTILSEHVPYVRSLSAGILVKTGSRYESIEEAGITHFLEHMLFKGTATRNSFKLANDIESRGGMINAGTSHEYTIYYVRGLDNELSTILDVLSDMIINPIFPAEELEKEKKVVIEEIKMYNDSPDDFVYEQFISQIFDKHPLGRPILGYEETINEYSREKLYAYMSKFYSPNNMIVSVAGNVNHDEIVDLIQKQFGHLKAVDEFQKTDEIPAFTKDRVVLRKEIEQTHLVIGRRALSSNSDDRFKFLLMNMILGVGFSSRLYQNIREKYGYCYSINTINQSFYDTGSFAVAAGTDEEYVDHLRELIFAEFKKMAETPVSFEELDSAKAKLNGMLLMGQESLNNRMNRMAKSEMYYGRYISLDEIEQNINKVTEEDIQSFCQDFLNPDFYSETVLLPSENE
jgi:predicted Zn-dependent peptidase